MADSLIMAFALASILVMGAICVMVVWRMQRTIDTLTNKIMAKDYREYLTTQRGTQDFKMPRMTQLSYFDDPQPEKETDQ